MTSPKRESREPIPQLLTVDEVATALRLSRSQVYELVATRSLEACRVGGRIRIPARAVSQLIEQSKI